MLAKIKKLVTIATLGILAACGGGGGENAASVSNTTLTTSPIANTLLP